MSGSHVTRMAAVASGLHCSHWWGLMSHVGRGVMSHECSGFISLVCTIGRNIYRVVISHVLLPL